MTKQFKKVGTHSGRFHADEVMATAILNEIFDIEVTRTRDNDILHSLDLVYDVGNGEFDHHHVDKEYRENGIPYAACGLIWRRFGQDAVRTVEPSLKPEEVEEVFQYMDAAVIQGIDASDNGMKTYDTIVPTMCISKIISGFNPVWDSDITEDEAFSEAAEFVSAVLNNTINQQISNIKARSYVLEAYKNRIRSELLIIETNYPWINALGDIDVEKEVLFVIYPRDGEFLMQTVRDYNSGLRDRKLLPRSWAGKRDEELNEIIGISDAVFCHPSRFIAGAKSFESIMKMAEIAIAEPEEERKEVPQGFLSALKRLLLKKKIIIKR